MGNPRVNSFYAVRGVTAGGEAAALSNRAGEFDFGLNGAVVTLPIVDHCGTISANQVWGPNAVHRLTCGVTIASARKLTVLPGTVVKSQSASIGMTVTGALKPGAVRANRVVLHLLKDDTVGGDTNDDGAATMPAPAIGTAFSSPAGRSTWTMPSSSMAAIMAASTAPMA